MFPFTFFLDTFQNTRTLQTIVKGTVHHPHILDIHKSFQSVHKLPGDIAFNYFNQSVNFISL